VGRLSDRFSPQLLVLIGLLIYAATFIAFAGVSVWTTAFSMTLFLICRFVAEAFIVSPNNLTALRALPESQVMMAAGLMWLLRSIANTVGPAGAAVLWDQRFGRHIQHVAESSPVDTFGYVSVTQHMQNTLVWMGEVAGQVPIKSMALMQRLLQTEASLAAWQDYLLCNALLAIIALLPALLVDIRLWKRFFLGASKSSSSAVGEKTSVADAEAGANAEQKR
jgi:MFS family permease